MRAAMAPRVNGARRPKKKKPDDHEDHPAEKSYRIWLLKP
jgi:hypothetical protein